MKPIILVVDDNPANLDLLFGLLDEAGFQVLVAKNGKSALKRAQTTNPNIILLDVMMPELDGFETCRLLKLDEVTRDIPVIFMTAVTETTEKVKGFELGAVDYITKPIQPEEVLARVNTHLTIQRLQRDLKTKNQQLSASLEREKELNKLRSRFIAMASHELRTPLTVLQFSMELLQRYGIRMSDEKKQEEFDTMQRTIKRMTGLLDELLMVSQAEAGQFEYRPEKIDLEGFCQHIVTQFQRMSAETHTLVFASQGERVNACVDPNLLQHVFSNLLSNAIKYSPAGGTVYFDLVCQGDTIMFRVKDEGIGISEADQHHLFDAFHRGVNVGNIEGTGLGLSIVKEFVKLHNGTIQVQSALNQGTTFTIILPYPGKE